MVVSDTGIFRKTGESVGSGAFSNSTEERASPINRANKGVHFEIGRSGREKLSITVPLIKRYTTKQGLSKLFSPCICASGMGDN